MQEGKRLAHLAAQEEFRKPLLIRGAGQGDDLTMIREWMGSQKFVELIGGSMDVPAHDIDNFLLNRTLGPAEFCYSVITPEDRVVRGFYYVAFDRKNRLAHLSGAFMTSSDEKHLAWRTIDPFLDYLFDEMRVFKVIVRIMPQNRKMLYAFMANIRFYKEAILKNEVVLPNGERSDIIVYAATTDMPRERSY